jgi:tripartite-type tricarboxylate transporter receptor subunit TctC
LEKEMQRRRFLKVAAGAVASAAIPSVTRAQGYPTRPVKLVVGAAPGGAPDLFARVVADWLSPHLGQPFVVDNRPGAGSNLATEAVVRAPADGHTLLMVTAMNAFSAGLYDNLSFDVARDIAPVAGVMHGTGVVVVRPTLAVRSIPELIAYAKADPGKLLMASAGIGSAPHLYGELFKSMAGVDLLHVPYRGGAAALTDLIAGHVDLMFDTIPTSIEHIRSGRLRILGVTIRSRWPALPEVPSVGEFLPGYAAEGWMGLGAPKGTPVEIIERLNRETNKGLADDGVRASFANLAAAPLTMSPTEFGAHVAAEIEKWDRVIRTAGIKV